MQRRCLDLDGRTAALVEWPRVFSLPKTRDVVLHPWSSVVVGQRSQKHVSFAGLCNSMKLD